MPELTEGLERTPIVFREREEDGNRAEGDRRWGRHAPDYRNRSSERLGEEEETGRSDGPGRAREDASRPARGTGRNRSASRPNDAAERDTSRFRWQWSGAGKDPDAEGSQTGSDSVRRESSSRKSAGLEWIPNPVSNSRAASSSPLESIFTPPGPRRLVRIHQTPWTGRLETNFGSDSRARGRGGRIVRKRFTVNSTSARTTGTPM
jgi:hypothetical protein